MKIKLFLFALTISLNMYSQLFNAEHLITSESLFPRAVTSADLDGDGDLDVIVGTMGLNKLAWFENLDGRGDFGPERLMGGNTDQVYEVHAADVDGDGDMDILIATMYSVYQTFTGIYWLENLDGQGNFSSKKVISYEAKGIYPSDLNGDGNVDIISYISGQGIVWFENLDGQGNFSSEKLISAFDGFSGTADIDNDGDLDIIRRLSNKIVWYENLDGLGNFGPERIIINNAGQFGSVKAADVNGDGNIDIIAISNNKIVWYEHLDGMGNFGPEQIIATNVVGDTQIVIKDIDNDGSIDIITSVRSEKKIAYYLNLNGQGSFGSEQIVTTSVNTAWQIHASDIDGDGDIDIVAPSENDHKLYWYENAPILNVENTENDFNFELLPNPSESIVTISFKFNILKVDIYNELGQLVMSIDKQNNLDISNLNTGIYFIRIKDKNGNVGIKKLMKK